MDDTFTPGMIPDNRASANYWLKMSDIRRELGKEPYHEHRWREIQDRFGLSDNYIKDLKAMLSDQTPLPCDRLDGCSRD